MSTIRHNRSDNTTGRALLLMVFATACTSAHAVEPAAAPPQQGILVTPWAVTMILGLLGALAGLVTWVWRSATYLKSIRDETMSQHKTIQDLADGLKIERAERVSEYKALREEIAANRRDVEKQLKVFRREVVHAFGGQYAQIKNSVNTLIDRVHDLETFARSHPPQPCALAAGAPCQPPTGDHAPVPATPFRASVPVAQHPSQPASQPVARLTKLPTLPPVPEMGAAPSDPGDDDLD